ncbi:hypothetical protein [Maricaulis sp.]|uniref:HAAS signaling domain-containing protein n=1 Tax=Maricaulis sp. TaxID=1486257 RepID=UPI00260AAC9A|nr:hypothetical protein [Maricaulis sp.]
MSTDPRIDKFCDALEQNLTRLGVEQPGDIVSEIRSHLLSAADSGALEAALDEMGSAGDYARQFRDELRIEDAYIRSGPKHTVATLILLSAHRLGAAIGLFFTGILYLTAVSVLVTIGFEIFNPSSTGLFTDDSGVFFLGTIASDTSAYTEHLGGFYIPVAAAMAMGFYLAGGAIARLALRLMRKKSNRQV